MSRLNVTAYTVKNGLANSKGLGWYDEANDRFQYVALPDSSGTNFSNHIAFDGHQLWLAGDKGLCRLDMQTLKMSETPVRDYLNYVVCDRRQGYVWIPVLPRGIYRFHPASGEVRFFPRKGNLSGLYAAPDGDVWITEADSLVHLNVETGLFEAFYGVKVQIIEFVQVNAVVTLGILQFQFSIYDPVFVIRS